MTNERTPKIKGQTACLQTAGALSPLSRRQKKRKKEYTATYNAAEQSTRSTAVRASRAHHNIGYRPVEVTRDCSIIYQHNAGDRRVRDASRPSPCANKPLCSFVGALSPHRTDTHSRTCASTHKKRTGGTLAPPSSPAPVRPHNVRSWRSQFQGLAESPLFPPPSLLTPHHQTFSFPSDRRCTLPSNPQ